MNNSNCLNLASSNDPLISRFIISSRGILYAKAQKCSPFTAI